MGTARGGVTPVGRAHVVVVAINGQCRSGALTVSSTRISASACIAVVARSAHQDALVARAGGTTNACMARINRRARDALARHVLATRRCVAHIIRAHV